MSLAAIAVVAMLSAAPTASAAIAPFSVAAVSCSGSFCAAVGASSSSEEGAAATSSDAGATWSTAANIDRNAFVSGVSCTSATFCAAYDQNGQVLTYNGSAWSAPAGLGSSGQLTSLSCAEPTFCAVVNTSGNAWTYNGTSWGSPNDIDGSTALAGVSCATSAFCVAGDGNGNVLTYNGTAWSAPSSLGQANQSTHAVSCPTSTFCLLTSYVIGTGAEYRTYNGSTWSAPSSAPPSLQGLSCASATLCAATSQSGAYIYNGSSWGSPTSLPNPSGAAGSVPVVSCANASSTCVAITGNTVYRYNGTSWTQAASISAASSAGNGPTPPPAPSGAVASASGSSSSSSGTATATLAGSTVVAHGYGALTLSEYGSDPVNGVPPGATGGYIDVHVAPGSTFSTVTVQDCNLAGGNTLYWHNGNTWAPVVPQSYSSSCATAVLSSTSSPTIAQLTGTVFAVAYTPKASTGAARVSGIKVATRFTCSGKAKSACKITLALLAAGPKGTRPVLIGLASSTATAGTHKTAVVSLNAAGKRMLAARHTLKATFAAVQLGRTIAVHAVTFKQLAKAKR